MVSYKVAKMLKFWIIKLFFNTIKVLSDFYKLIKTNWYDIELFRKDKDFISNKWLYHMIHIFVAITKADKYHQTQIVVKVNNISNWKETESETISEI